MYIPTGWVEVRQNDYKKESALSALAPGIAPRYSPPLRRSRSALPRDAPQGPLRSAPRSAPVRSARGCGAGRAGHGNRCERTWVQVPLFATLDRRQEPWKSRLNQVAHFPLRSGSSAQPCSVARQPDPEALRTRTALSCLELGHPAQVAARSLMLLTPDTQCVRPSCSMLRRQRQVGISAETAQHRRLRLGRIIPLLLPIITELINNNNYSHY